MYPSQQVNTTSRVPGSTSYRTRDLQPKRKTTAPLTIRPISTRQPSKQLLDQTTPQEDGPLDEFTAKFISNLQGQIHLLELESKILHERLSASDASNLDTDVDSSELDPKMRELRALYRKREEEANRDKQVGHLISILSTFLFFIVFIRNYKKKLMS